MMPKDFPAHPILDEVKPYSLRSGHHVDLGLPPWSSSSLRTRITINLVKWTGNDDAQMVNIPLRIRFPEGEGFRIGRGSADRLTSVVSDDLTGLTEFTVRVLGYRHYP